MANPSSNNAREVVTEVMPFGKHKGTPLAKLPLDYVTWILKQDWMKGPLRRKLQQVVPPFDVYGTPEPDRQPVERGSMAYRRLTVEKPLDPGIRRSYQDDSQRAAFLKQIEFERD